MNEKILDLLSKTVKEDANVHGLMVYNFSKQEVVATTFSPEDTEKFMKVEKLYMDLETEHATKVDPAGERNWLMVSLSRKIVYSIKITNEFHLYADLEPAEAPSAAIENGLELGLMIGRML
ncbi:MAG: hypothetical protein A2821_01870 [Candidatus Magasanikbacteria bacterium RIFCSPHIGHO2_01_FULL_41_23]|uniref:Uncharacterized protein n=1 Tax=Candidatus Magasanikbacteria bacterium RIFCSPLOWO2_01_FULL_40_15 TaxID=1798686 RepID=A0A1F6N396_9BACT|nr:MAG: hypothetical protein A2821_01870 [Candidatus Magasanikbacteria bacterium RIFCSPHIGHO2_01_FULL_41_23]OGH67094.1 MAG: hypothetical protein A3C66_00175 [Candidatus Magasanikbacteria bacterium RIFCSPHIGHO2_02_FULL_41_35]OGH76414.1 MAG: hypothetical protein A3F22_02345 [Candidatus Magasanikbacteria bacterium RIFCSPHIGHO2_12_FULL_41_16]OGH78361.1 MAG: hypothetical protein A2983_00120 [Candidatus Magasanikbacteria bacterium RIFCSPLOWO2_01_FULL_40_15]